MDTIVGGAKEDKGTVSPSSSLARSSLDDVHAHFCARVGQSEVQADPFAHLYVRDVFPSDFYRRLLDQLPADDAYSRYPAPYESRLFFDLTPSVTKGMADFWQAFETWINGQAFLDCMVAKFEPYLASHTDYRRRRVDKASNGDVVKIGSRTLVARDYGDFKLGPHTDAPGKFIVVIFYLPEDDRFAKFGTSIYRPKESGFTSWESTHFKHDQFDRVRTAPNVPNSAFAFIKTDNSFHGVDPGDYPNDGRNMVMWAPVIGASTHNSEPLEVQRRVFGLGSVPINGGTG